MHIEIIGTDTVKITAESDNEKSYVKNVLEKLLYTFEDTDISGVLMGFKITGKVKKG